MARLCSYSRPAGKMGRLPSLAPADQGFLVLMTAIRSCTDEMRYKPGCLPVTPPLHALNLQVLSTIACKEQLSGCSLCTCISARRSEAHHNLDVLPRGIDPCSAAPLAASLASLSAVISIRQGCTKFEANLQQDVHIAPRSPCVELILTAELTPRRAVSSLVFAAPQNTQEAHLR
jgi:hypothetical protein